MERVNSARAATAADSGTLPSLSVGVGGGAKATAPLQRGTWPLGGWEGKPESAIPSDRAGLEPAGRHRLIADSVWQPTRAESAKQLPERL